MIKLIRSGKPFSNWYGATVILTVKARFALTIALYETPLSYRLLKKFKICLIAVPINDSHYLICMLYSVLVLSRNDAFNILTVVSLLL